ncbi:hypothetical protein OIV83_006278 [Microbotryomycetes sp. JL201]|nr:hypothetical protein OIV83_006278 [Microbotryomycetes sp. JL201]
MAALSKHQGARPPPTPPATPPLPVADQSRVAEGAATEPPIGLAQLLRDATALAHSDVMLPAVVHSLVKGLLPRDVYLRYLVLLHGVYTHLDAALEHHSTNQHLARVFDAKLLARADSLDDDCSWFAGTRNWHTDSAVARHTLENKPFVALEYEDRLRQLAGASGKRSNDVDDCDEDKTLLLLAHAYVRYLGDLSGGQAIAKSLRKAYGLPESGEGSAFYEFFIPGSDNGGGLPRRATAHELKQVKARFRAGLDAAGRDMTIEQRQRVVDEALYAFKLNMGIFESFSDMVPSADTSLDSLHKHLKPGMSSLVPGPRCPMHVAVRLPAAVKMSMPGMVTCVLAAVLSCYVYAVAFSD